MPPRHGQENMAQIKFEIERSRVISAKRFNEPVAALKTAVGHPDMAEFAKMTKGARTFAELESRIEKGLGKTGLMMFMELDQGSVLRKETGLGSLNIIRFLIGNQRNGAGGSTP